MSFSSLSCWIRRIIFSWIIDFARPLFVFLLTSSLLTADSVRVDFPTRSWGLHPFMHIFSFWNLTCTPVHEGQGSLISVPPFKSKDAASFNLPDFCLLLGRITIGVGIPCTIPQYLFCYRS